MRHRKDGTIMIKRSREPLEGFKRYAKLADATASWLEETSRRQSTSVTLNHSRIPLPALIEPS